VGSAINVPKIERRKREEKMEMRKGNLLCLGLVVSLLISTAAVNVTMVHAETTRLYVDPPTITTRPPNTFTIDLKIANAHSICGYNFTIYWYPGPFRFVSVEEGDFLKSGGDTWWSPIGPWGGPPGIWILDIGCAALPFLERTVSGSGTLATLTFECVGAGETPIRFWQIDGLSPCDTVDGYLYSDQPLPPKASFTQSSVTAMTGDPVSFDASSSTSGWSGTGDAPIVSYAWDFESDGIVDAHGITVTHAFPSPGTFGVTLNVTDSQGLWNTVTHSTEIIGRVSFTTRPPVLNLRFGGPWIICDIQPPTGCHPSDIDVSSIRLDGTIPVAPNEPSIYTPSDLIVKFDSATVISYILSIIDPPPIGHSLTVELTLTGELKDGALFRGTGTITVILPKAIGKSGLIAL
jgi:PKD repeat protein